MAFNPISALTGATLGRIAADPGLHDLTRTLMLEGRAVAEAFGVAFSIGVDKRIAGAAEVGEHRTSMLQDLERGRPMEIDALLGAVVELGAMVDHPMPVARSVLALVRERGRQAGCYG
jgi:2-dehydropantoate 2-reductase